MDRNHRIRSTVEVWPAELDLPNAFCIHGSDFNTRDTGNTKIQDLWDVTTCEMVNL